MDTNSSRPMIESDCTIVHDAETLFLAGNFRKALMLCNKILKDPKPSAYDRKIVKVPLETTLSLSVDITRKNRRMVLDFDAAERSKTNTDSRSEDDDSDNDSRISLVDRAATVSLQSWYEISRSIEYNKGESEKKKETEAGRVHLLPFLDAYLPEARTAPRSASRGEESENNTENYKPLTKPRAMPLELAVVFVYFIRTIGEEHIHDCVELGSEIIWEIAASFSKHSNKAIPRYIKTSFRELIDLLFLEMLPYCSCGDTIDNILTRFSNRGKKKWKPASWQLVVTDQVSTNRDTLIKLHAFLKIPPKAWTKNGLINDSFVQRTRGALRRLLKLWELEMKNATVPLSSEDTSNTPETSLFADPARRQTTQGSSSTAVTTNDSSDVGRVSNAASLPGRFLQSLLQLREKKGVLVQKLCDHKSSIAFALIIILVAWKRRKRLFHVSASALRLFLAPIREVVDAVMKPP